MPAAPRAASVWLSESGPASSIWRVFAGDVFRWMPIVQRLKTRPQFQVTLACGIVSRTAHFALHRSPLDRSPAGDSRPDHAGPDARPLFGVQDVWVGAMVPKRWARRAVTRNTIKRQIYQVSATFEPRLAAAAHVVRLRATFDRSQFISATSDVLKRAVRGELELDGGQVGEDEVAAPDVVADEAHVGQARQPVVERAGDAEGGCVGGRSAAMFTGDVERCWSVSVMGIMVRSAPGRRL